MKKINFKGVFVAGIASAVTFMIIEFIVEYAIARNMGISEAAYFEHFDVMPSGMIFQILNLLIFFLEMMLMIYVYAAVRPRFSSNIEAGLGTSMIFIFLGFLVFANFTNLGIFPIEMSITSFIFNLLELPPALLVGAVLYGEG